MENIKLNIEGFLCRIKEEVNAFEPKVKAAVEGLEKALVLETIFWAGCIFHLLSPRNIWPTSRQQPRCFATTAGGHRGRYRRQLSGARAVIEGTEQQFPVVAEEAEWPCHDLCR